MHCTRPFFLHHHHNGNLVDYKLQKLSYGMPYVMLYLTFQLELQPLTPLVTLAHFFLFQGAPAMISHHEPAWGTEAEPMPALASPIREGSLVCAGKNLLASSAGNETHCST